jgi:hypothetical protein
MGLEAQIEVTPTWHERPILWVPLVAPRGAGKSPSQDLAFQPLRDHDRQLGEDGIPVLLGDQTLEALARSLHASGGAAALDLDELPVLLRGLGEYKRGGGGDRGRFLSLWSGAPWSFTRVGGGTRTNAVRLPVHRPTLVICGGLQTVLHELLGGENDGLRPRWLIHLAAMSEEEGVLSNGQHPVEWQTLLGGQLLPQRRESRTWKLNDSGLATFQHYRRSWKAQARGPETASTAAALAKAPGHLARVALVLAEAENPGLGGETGADLVERAAAIIDYTLNCWRALPEQGTLSLSRRDELLDRGIVRLIDWLEAHGGAASKRELQRARVAGCRTAGDLDALLKRYEESFPGCVTEAPQEQGGLPTMVVRAPSRRPVTTVAPLVTPYNPSAQNPHGCAESDRVATGDTATGDTAPDVPYDEIERLLDEVGE